MRGRLASTPAKRRQRGFEVVWKRNFDLDLVDDQSSRMQHLPGNFDRHRVARSAVLRVSNHGMPEMRHRRSNLMQKARLESNLDERCVLEDLDRYHVLPTRMTTRSHCDMGRLMALDRER